MRTILFFSYKGGVGRSLALCNIAAALCRKGRKVGIVDLDVEAPSIHIHLKKVIDISKEKDPLAADILTLFRNDPEGLTPQGVTEALMTVRTPWPSVLCKIIPCFGREYDLDALQKVWKEKVHLLNSIVKMFGDKEGLDFLLLDARSGYTEQAVLAAFNSDEVIAVTKADNVSIPGLKMMLNLFKEKPMRIHLLVSSLPQHIRESDKRIVNFVKALGIRSKPIITRFIPEWYFGGEVIWEPDSSQKVIVKPYDELVRKLIKS
jgi:MinD-like ATPase involved in chromosome partitioning or flagellar assembly